MQSYFFMLVYLVLNFNNFKYAEKIYHFAVEDALRKNDELITSMRMGVSDWYYANISFIWDYTKRTFAGIFAVLSRFLPGSLQLFLSGYVERASQYATGVTPGGTDEYEVASEDTVSLDTD